MKQIRFLILLAAIASAFALLTGCATERDTTTTSITGNTTNTISQHYSKTDALASKVVEQDDDVYGVDFNFLGSSSFSPFHLKAGMTHTRYRSLPTSTNTVFTAPYNLTQHRNYSIINQAGDENVSTTTNLPAQAFVGPNVQTMNPLPNGILQNSAQQPALTNSASK